MKYATATRCIALLALALVAACERNTETAPHCAADTIRCNDIHIERCEADGSAWRYISSCPSNAACDAGECVCPAGESCECPDSDSLLLGECIQRSDPSRLLTARLHPQTVTSWLPTTLTVYAEASAEPGAVLAAIEAQGGAVSAYEASVRRYTAIFHDDTTAEALYEARAALHAAPSIRLAVPIWLAQDDLAECPMAIETSCAASGHGSVPNDPWPTSDHLTWNTCAPDGPNWFLEAIHAPEAWARLGNEAPRVKIGVIDTRHVEHPDIDLPEARKRYLPTIWSELNEEMDAKAEVYFGFDTGATDNASQLRPCVVEHGLMVSSIAAAVGGNGLGGSGVLRNAELYYCQYDKKWATFGDCLKWLVDVQGVRVVNLSQGANFRSTGGCWGQCDLKNFCIPNPQDDTVNICAYTANGVEQSCQEHDDCTDVPPEPSAPGSIWREVMPLMAEEWETYFEALQSDDWLLVQSLGNDAIVDATYTRQGLLVSPEWREHIVMATAHDRQEERPDYANYGPADISAPGGDGSHEPGEDIFVACHDKETGADTYSPGEGTSFAAPLVSGTLALAWSLYPELSAPDLKELVLEGGRQTGTVEMSGGMTTYHHPRLDMLGAIEAVQQQCVCEGRTVDPATGACVGTTGPAEDGCEGRCGKFTSGASCQCNAGCFEYGDCCADLCAVCGDSFADACGGECEPACGGLQCGDDDGCGSPCDGSCPDGESCQGGQCVAGPCVSDCDGKDCGDDGCGGSCGPCAGSTTCIGGECICEPSCAGKDCGDDDGCGSPCDGDCPSG
ncbi:MAG: S8 family serine peptidase, partial [Myxococcota bacterium]|nr:S8 family serine peptidase [Myxococcota bacterium]